MYMLVHVDRIIQYIIYGWMNVLMVEWMNVSMNGKIKWMHLWMNVMMNVDQLIKGMNV